MYGGKKNPNSKEADMTKNNTNKKRKPTKKTIRNIMGRFTFSFSLNGSVDIYAKDYVMAQCKLVSGIYKLLGQNINGGVSLEKIDGGKPLC